MPDRPLRRALLPVLLACLAVSACSRPSFLKGKKTGDPVLVAAADAATANATSFSVTLIETDIQRRGTIATGSIALNAPLARATAGTWSLSGAPSRSVLPAGKTVAAQLRDQRRGQVEVSHSGILTILTLLDKKGDPILKIMGPPHGNAIQKHWYYLGHDSGLANVTPRP